MTKTDCGKISNFQAQGGKIEFSGPDRSWVNGKITAKLYLLNFLGVIPNKLGSWAKLK